MTSAIDPTKPADGALANKGDLRTNLTAAKSEIEALQDANLKTETGTTVSVDAAYVGALYSAVVVNCSNSGDVTVTLESDVPAGKIAQLRQAGSGGVTAVAGASASIEKLAGASDTTAGQYDSLFYQSFGSGVWGLI